MRVTAVWAGVLVAMSLSSQRALADAVPPPPERCPPGFVAVTSHHGPECLRKGSTNCKGGYCAERGGTRVPSSREAYGSVGDDTPAPVVPTRPVESAKPPDSAKPLESAKPPESAKPLESAKPFESAKPPSGSDAPKSEEASGGCRRGCAVSSTSNLAAWLAVPLMVAAAFARRRTTRRVRA